MIRKIDWVVLHCSDSDYPKQDANWINGIHKDRGWNKIGYTYFIPFSGIIERGRGLDEPTAAAKGYNYNGIHICLAGRKNFNETQFESLRTLLILLKHLCPKAKLVGHCELNKNKTCPNYNYSEFSNLWQGVSLSTKNTCNS